MKTPWGLKNKMIIKHTTTITEVKIDHTKRQLLTHKAPPGACGAKYKTSQWE